MKIVSIVSLAFGLNLLPQKHAERCDLFMRKYIVLISLFAIILLISQPVSCNNPTDEDVELLVLSVDAELLVLSVDAELLVLSVDADELVLSVDVELLVLLSELNPTDELVELLSELNPTDELEKLLSELKLLDEKSVQGGAYLYG